MSDPDLPELFAHDVDARVGERIRRRAHAVLDRERALLGRPRLARAVKLYDRALEPALAAGACVVYLTWAVQATLALMP